LRSSDAAALGTYNPAISARYDGEPTYLPSAINVATTLVAGTPAISWAPANLAYGTPLGASQLNAASTTAGTFTYLPAAGTVLNAGLHTLEATFTPADTEHWVTRTESRSLTVAKLTPLVTVTGGSFVYDGTPHTATASATGGAGETLPLTITYNGSTTAPTNAGTYEVMARFAGDDNHSLAWATATLTIARAVPAVEVSTEPIFYSGQARQAIVAVRGLGGVELFPYTVLYDGATTLPVDAGTYAVQVRFDGDVNYAPVTGDGTLVINKTTPIMGLSAPTLTYDGQPHAASAAVIGVSNEPLTPVVITYNGGPDVPVNAGVYTVVARYDGSDNYTAVEQTTTLTIVKALSSLTWAPPASIVYGTPLGALQLRATTVTPGDFAYSPAAGAVLNAGPHTLSVVFTPADSVNYTGATLSVPIQVTKAYPGLSWAAITDVVYGTPLGDAQLNATASVPGTYTYTPAAGTVLTVGSHLLQVSFAPTDSNNYYSGSTGASLRVVAAPSVLTWPQPADIVYGTALGSAQLNATANVAGTFTYFPAAGTMLAAGATTLDVTFTPSDQNYTPATASVTLNVLKATPAMAIVTADATYDGQPHGATGTVTGVGGAALGPIVFTYNGSTDVPVKAGTYAVVASFAGDANYSAVSATGSMTIAKASTALSWAAPADITYGTPLGDAQLNATASVPGTFAYSPAAGTVLAAGATTLDVTFTPSDPNYTPATASVTLNVLKATPAIAIAASDATYDGQPHGATGKVNGLDGTPLGTITFTYNGSTDVPINAGTYAVVASFAGDANYSAVSTTGSMTINRAPLTVRATDAVKRFGAPLPALGATIAGFVNGETAASLSGTLVVTTAATQQSPVGIYALVPSGVSSTNYAVTFVGGTLSVVRGLVDVGVTTSPEPSGVDQPMTFTASVAAAAPAAGAPAGVVRFFDGTTLLGSAPLITGVATLSTAGLDAGPRAIEARYDGDGSFEPGTASSTHVIRDASQTPALTLASSRNPSNVGQSVTLTAYVSMASGAVPGTVEFYDGSTLLGTSPISAGRATLTTTSLAAGSHAITARYPGWGDIPPSRSEVFVQSVGAGGWKDRTTTMAIETPNPVALGDEVMVTAEVTGGSATPGGHVLFMVDGAVVAEVAVTPLSATTARASLAVPGLAHGRHAISATYLGDSNYKGSTARVIVAVN
jgi:hypothetical protein